MDRRLNGVGGHWHCRECLGSRAKDRTLGIVAEKLEIHRLICEDCGVVGHYDCEGNGHPKESLHGRFKWVETAVT